MLACSERTRAGCLRTACSCSSPASCSTRTARRAARPRAVRVMRSGALTRRSVRCFHMFASFCIILPCPCSIISPQYPYVQHHSASSFFVAPSGADEAALGRLLLDFLHFYGVAFDPREMVITTELYHRVSPMPLRICIHLRPTKGAFMICFDRRASAALLHKKSSPQRVACR